MRNTPDWGPETRGRHSLDRARPQWPGRRTATAGLEFLKALGGDLANLAAQLRSFLTERRQSGATRPQATVASSGGMSRPRTARRSVHRLVLGTAIAVIAGMAIVSGALLWALLGLPVDKPASEPQKPALLLEAVSPGAGARNPQTRGSCTPASHVSAALRGNSGKRPRNRGFLSLKRRSCFIRVSM